MLEFVIAMMKNVQGAFGPVKHAHQLNVDINAASIEVGSMKCGKDKEENKPNLYLNHAKYK